jgi:trimethylguanosine synthase
MTDDAWFGVTHESVANKISKHIASVRPKNRLIAIDVFAGVGGNTIALALSNQFKRVYAIEKDPATLMCAKHNAEIYGVADKITWWQGDCFDILGVNNDKEESRVMAELAREHSIIFASPPWGGTYFQFLCRERQLSFNRTVLPECRRLRRRDYGAV